MKVRFIGFDNVGGQPVAAYNDAELADDGQIVHSVDGVVRAIIPPEGWTEYVAVWPGIQPVIDSATSTASKPASSTVL